MNADAAIDAAAAPLLLNGDTVGEQDQPWVAFGREPGERSLLIYEARTACTDPASTARFGLHRTPVSPRVAARNASGGQEGGRDDTVRIRGRPRFWRR
ncbi:hypothetical protein FBY35_0317 [Streptomyces sp. SLBN-118]|uniref:hypothetical protein n=1 Tax=Streptomyces sp. SLBN-118 TaxID=2768454 RepID=UPI0011534B48|nr:hypothetical protein [Streptomyces sp. SLBN-118]TQK50024.1 hypothetical protein FBY35_0317 [Streptomyces sp. SLBN-118]